MKTINLILKDFGLNLRVLEKGDRKKLIINFDEEILEPIKGYEARLGRRPRDIDFEIVGKMQAEGKTSKQIYQELGIPKATYYLKMKEHREGKKMNYKEGRLGYNPRTQRYGLLVSDLWEIDGFHCGNHLEVYIDGEWIPTQIEMNNKEQWYLVGVNKKGMELEDLKKSIFVTS